MKLTTLMEDTWYGHVYLHTCNGWNSYGPGYTQARDMVHATVEHADRVIHLATHGQNSEQPTRGCCSIGRRDMVQLTATSG